MTYLRALLRLAEYTEGLEVQATRLEASWNRWTLTRSKPL